MKDSISEALNIPFSTNELEHKIEEKKTNIIPKTDEQFNEILLANRKNDYLIVRENLVDVINSTQEIVEEAVNEVKNNPSARMFETFAILIKTYSELNKDLISINGPITLPKNDVNVNDKINNNIVFMGTNDDLIDQIRKIKK